MPPSEITAMLRLLQTSTVSTSAVNCGTPTPATNARGADRARADADLDRVRARIDQRLRAVSRRDVAGDDLRVIGKLPYAAHGLQHAFGMAMRGVNHDQIDLGIEQRFGARHAVLAGAGRRGDAQPAFFRLWSRWGSAAPFRCP